VLNTPTEYSMVMLLLKKHGCKYRPKCSTNNLYQYKYFKKPHVSRTWANFFSERIVNAWNFLPDIVDFSSLSRFKRSIHKVNFSKFLKCFYNIMLYFVLLVYFVYFYNFFFLKATTRACHEPGVSCSKFTFLLSQCAISVILNE